MPMDRTYILNLAASPCSSRRKGDRTDVRVNNSWNRKQENNKEKNGEQTIMM